MFRASDLEAQTCDMIRKTAARLLGGSTSIQSVKDQTITTTVNTLYAYRKFCASNNSTGQLILPEGLKVLPLYCLGFHKSPGMRSDAHADDRAAWLLNGLCAPVKMCVPSVYPRNFPVHRLVDKVRVYFYLHLHLLICLFLSRMGDSTDVVFCSQGADEGTVFPPLPTVTWLSAEKLEQDGIYVLEDARELLVWVGRQCPEAVLRETFGVDHVDHIQSNTSALAQLDTKRSKSLNAFVNCMRRMRSGYLRMRILRRGKFILMLVRAIGLTCMCFVYRRSRRGGVLRKADGGSKRGGDVVRGFPVPRAQTDPEQVPVMKESTSLGVRTGRANSILLKNDRLLTIKTTTVASR